jgi:hypothetical protein
MTMGQDALPPQMYASSSTASTAYSVTNLNRRRSVASISRQTTGEFFSVWEYKRNFHDSLIRR